MSKEIMEEIKNSYQKVRNNKPLVHCICNTVTINDCANILLAVGARPTMACHIHEVAEITAGCQSLVCNLGATRDYEAIREAVAAANRLGHAVVVDPVGVAASTFRREFLTELLDTSEVSCIRGNASEIQAIYEQHSTAAGVDAVEDIRLTPEERRQSYISLARNVSKKYRCIVWLSGATDIITDGNITYQIENGHPMMTCITGSGCMSSVLVGAFMAEAFKPNLLQATIAAALVMGISGELAAERCIHDNRGTMTFRQYMIDEISCMSPDTLEAMASLERSV